MTSRREVAPTPVRIFDGDEYIEPELYKQLMAGGYMSTFALAEEGLEAAGVTLDDISKERWRRLACASYYIDEFIDTVSDKREAHVLYERGMNLALHGAPRGMIDELLVRHEDVNPLLVPSILLLRNSVADVATDELTTLQQAALTINDVAIEKASTEDCTTYERLLMVESDATVALLEHSVTPNVAQQSAFHTFTETMRFIMRVAVYADSTFDLKDDYEQGVTRVTPTLRHMGSVALQAFQAAREASWPPERLRISWRMASSVRPYVVFGEK